MNPYGVVIKITIRRSIMIHQPHFFPWAPYMARVALSEIFVVLDDLSYRKSYYQNRTRLIDRSGNSIWLTLPVVGGRHTPTNQMKLASNCEWFMKKLARTVKYNYLMSPYFDGVWKPVNEFLMDIGTNSHILRMSTVSINSIKLMYSLLEMKPPIIRLSSELDVRNLERTERILKICQLTGKKTFLTGWGGGVDPRVHNLQLLANEGIEIKQLSRDILMKIEPDFVREGISTLHWIFIKGPTYVRERLLEYEHVLTREYND